MFDIQPFHMPQEIEAASFAIIDAEVGEPKPFSGLAWNIARRMVHSCADFEILNNLHLPDSSIQAGIAALRGGCVIYTDTEMAKTGMSRFRLDRLGPNKGGVEALSVLSLPGVAERALSNGCTRSKAGVELAWQRQSLIIGLPVGFVNAAESKEALLKYPELPSLTLRGRKGGSTLVAAVVNALAELALQQNANS